ncbi:MAG TPA: hypothetical protein DET40_06670 [Lentisphaeria bacterium]|nr:MAG: hypothetical protein A2X45_01120 [Lentisphaerae bacterium GWF2_50_93]HCE43212.1 hypothetical protein [Lentisphaeria bacterium]
MIGKKILAFKAMALMLAMFAASILFAEEAAVPQFQNGDRVCFIGDSITHGGQYHVQILLYYLTRFPDRKFEAYNCGVSGDYAGGVLKRYDWDIKPHNPTVSTIMLGMNDVGRDNYGKDKTGPDFDNKHKWALEGYMKNMTKLSEMLAADKSKIIYLTPSIYDQTGNMSSHNYFGVNDALGTCAQEGRRLSEKFNGGLVDFHGLMSRINEEQQKKNSSFTIVGGDRVHPGMEGHFVMAYAFLKAQKCPSIVSDMSVDAAKSAVVKQDNCQITELKAENGTVSFTCKENALPFPISDVMVKKLEPLVPFTNDLNREMLSVSGLAAGDYKILIDGQEVQEATAEDLAKGINIANNSKTPQYKQAWAVSDPVWKKYNLESSKLRSIVCIRNGILANAKVKPGDVEAEKKVLEAELDKCKKSNNKYVAGLIETYMKCAPDQKKFEDEAAAFWESAYSKNQTKPHKFEIRKK